MKTKKWQRRLLRVFGGLVLLLLMVFIFSTQTIDTTPYFQTDYYRNTIANIDASVSNMTEANGKLRAGFARTNITPTIVNESPDASKGEFNSIKMAGFGEGKIADGVHDSIYAKAIALQVGDQEVFLVSADLVFMAETVVLRVEENLKGKISRKNILFGATHTHSSIGNCMPSFVGKSFGGEYQPKVVEWLAGKFTQLILDAQQDKRPAQFSSGHIHVPNVVRNRIIGETGRLNAKLNLVSVTQDEGRSAAIGIFSAHATVIGSWNDDYSGDYPGYFQRSLESKGIDVALFFAGTVGSHSNKGEGEKFAKAEHIGKVLADSAQVLLNTMEYDSVMTLATLTAELETPELQAIYISDRLRLSPFVGSKLMPELQSIPLQGLRLNDLIWLAMPYELSGEYGIDLKNALELEGYHSALTSFNGQYLGYIVPPKYYYFDTYEARLMGWYGPSMGDYLMELNFKLANALTGKRL